MAKYVYLLVFSSVNCSYKRNIPIKIRLFETMFCFLYSYMFVKSFKGCFFFMKVEI